MLFCLLHWTFYRDISVKKKKLDLDNHFPYLLKTISEYISLGTSRSDYDGVSIGIREWRVLSLLALSDDITAKDITALSGMDKATVSRAISRLRSDGLIETETDPNSWRSQKLSLTPKGIKVYDQMVPAKLERAERMHQELTDAEYKQLIKLLKKLRTSVVNTLEIDVPYSKLIKK